MKYMITIILTLIVLLGCTSTTGLSLKEKDAEYAKYIINNSLTNKDRVNGFKFDGWKPLSDNYLIITAVRKKNYLVETLGRCMNLEQSQEIKLNQTSKLTISKLGDSITPIGKVTNKCFIKTIYPLTNAQASFLVNIGKPVQSGGKE
jgi:hypothetical protein